MNLNLIDPSNSDSSQEVRNFFDKFYQNEVSFPAVQIDAVVGYFMKRDFAEESAKVLAIILLNQARTDNISVFKLVDTLKGLTDLQLSAVVTEVLNTYRERTSALGYRINQEPVTIESRNIKP
jgi:hypothetical protein